MALNCEKEKKTILLKTCGRIVPRKLHFATIVFIKRRKSESMIWRLVFIAGFSIISLMKKYFPLILDVNHRKVISKSRFFIYECKLILFCHIVYVARGFWSSLWNVFTRISFFLYYSRRWNPHSRFCQKKGEALNWNIITFVFWMVFFISPVLKRRNWTD